MFQQVIRFSLVFVLLSPVAGFAAAPDLTEGDPLESTVWPTLKKEFFPPNTPVEFDARVKVEVPKFADDAMNVPVTVDASALPNVKKLVILVDRNPIRKVLEFVPEGVKPSLSFRFKLEQASPIRAAALTSDGVWHVGSAQIDASGGGCTVSGASRKDGSWSKTLNQVAARKFEVPGGQQGSLRLRLRVLHPMDTGLVAGIPSFFIKQMALKDADGKLLATVYPFEPVSENPLFSFDFDQAPAGPISLEGKDNNGNLIAVRGL
ncbi:MAG: quinoprotein dehydrogenase-associated SoxYZ-like carrier [Burkholderiales bacterium]|nr:quinoprotein dehydrogenase-associated SoxYZ-like carrier [Burkholderiales bacterium]